MAVDDLLPLTPAVYQIMLALVDGERHGYGILKAVRAATQGRMRFGTGTLYRSLDYMLDIKIIEEGDTCPDPAVNAHAAGRHFRLTDLGKRVFAAETERIVHLARAGEAARDRLRRQDPRRAASPVSLRSGGA